MKSKGGWSRVMASDSLLQRLCDAKGPVEKLLGGSVGGGDARGTEGGGMGPLYLSQSSTGTMQWRSSGEELLSDGGVFGSVSRGKWERRRRPSYSRSVGRFRQGLMRF
jgi:hypothetical protein